MKLFIDSANIDEIKIAKKDWNIISGVTTNPTLLSKERKNYEDIIKEIVEITGCHVSVETTKVDTKGMVEDAKRFSGISNEIVTKIPMTTEGLKAIATIQMLPNSEHIRTNATLIFSTSQAMLASLAGADYVSIFVGRLDDIGHSGINIVGETVNVFKNLDVETNVIAASIRHPLHVIEYAKVGTDIVKETISIDNIC